MSDRITAEQREFYQENKQELIDEYLTDFPFHIDPDAIRDRFAPLGYDRTNVSEFQGVCKTLTKDIFYVALNRNRDRINKVIFAAGLPATGKTSHLLKMSQNELIYDGTINDEKRFVQLVQHALDMGYEVEVFVYSADPKRAFESNLKRGDTTGRYVPISQYEKVAKSINRRKSLLQHHFKGRVKFRNFEYTNFEGKQTDFSPITVKRNELKNIANNHQFPNSKKLQEVLK